MYKNIKIFTLSQDQKNGWEHHQEFCSKIKILSVVPNISRKTPARLRHLVGIKLSGRLGMAELANASAIGGSAYGTHQRRLLAPTSRRRLSALQRINNDLFQAYQRMAILG